MIDEVDARDAQMMVDDCISEFCSLKNPYDENYAVSVQDISY